MNYVMRCDQFFAALAIRIADDYIIDITSFEFRRRLRYDSGGMSGAGPLACENMTYGFNATYVRAEGWRVEQYLHWTLRT